MKIYLATLLLIVSYTSATGAVDLSLQVLSPLEFETTGSNVSSIAPGVTGVGSEILRKRVFISSGQVVSPRSMQKNQNFCAFAIQGDSINEVEEIQEQKRILEERDRWKVWKDFGFLKLFKERPIGERSIESLTLKVYQNIDLPKVVIPSGAKYVGMVTRNAGISRAILTYDFYNPDPNERDILKMACTLSDRALQDSAVQAEEINAILGAQAQVSN